jgi:hypothetical protein
MRTGGRRLLEQPPNGIPPSTITRHSSNHYTHYGIVQETASSIRADRSGKARSDFGTSTTRYRVLADRGLPRKSIADGGGGGRGKAGEQRCLARSWAAGVALQCR